MNILLVEPEKYKSWGHNQQYIGLLKIGAYHESIGNNVEYVYAPELPKRISNPDEIYVTSLFTYWYKKSWEAVKHYKGWYPNSKVMLGGIYATLCPEHAMQSGADEVMVGQHPEAKKHPPNPLLLPEKPDFAYCMTSYGCSGNCKFCGTHAIYGAGIKQREVEEVVNEIQLQYDRGFRKIYFGDDDLLCKADKHFIPIMNEILKRKLKIEFYVYGGLQARWMNDEIAEIIKKAKFKYLSFGLESVSKDILDKMNRGYLGGVSALDNALDCLKKVKFDFKNITVFFMVGLPYQTQKDMLATLIYVVKKGLWAEPQRWAPIPGTPDFITLGLDKYDLEDLYYKKYVAPGQDEKFLDDIYKMARYFNCGLRYSGYNLFASKHLKEMMG